MEFKELIKDRYSVRDFKNIPVEEHLIDEILEAGRISPSACNKQPTVVYIVTNQQEKLKEITKYIFNTYNNLLICYDKNISHKRSGDGYDFGIEDAAIVTTHMMLKIHDLGLGACWVGYVNAEKLRELYDIPENIVPVALLPFGYISDESKPNPLHYNRKSMEEFKREL